MSTRVRGYAAAAVRGAVFAVCVAAVASAVGWCLDAAIGDRS